MSPPGEHVLHAPADGTGLVQSVLRYAPTEAGRRAPGPDRVEVWFVVSGGGRARLGERETVLRPQIAVALWPGEECAVEAGPYGVEIVAVSAPDEAGSRAGPAGDPAGGPVEGPAGSAARTPVLDLADRIARDAVSEREYRLLHGPDTGCRGITQFVGYIPPIRTPLHYHPYSEMAYVLSGHGRVEIDGAGRRVAAGSAFYLPAGRHHLVENLGTGHLRLLGVFTPAGSPDVAHPVEER